MGQRRVFISYSTKDQDFVRALAASLEIVGVQVLRDETGVMVGDSIPEWIYASLESASDVVYVLSEHAIASPWVREELSAAKMRQKREAGFGIRPVLIDDVPLPTSMAHIRFADFRQWRDPVKYRMATQLLLKSLDVESPTLDTDETEWWLGASARLAAAHRAVSRAAAAVWIGAKCADGDRATVKYGALLMEGELMAGLSLLESLIATDRGGGDRLQRLSSEIAEVRRDYDRIQASQTGSDADLAARAFQRTADRLAANLEEIETGALAIVAATVRPQAEG